MLTWPIDNAFTIYILLGCIALGLLAIWWNTRKKEILYYLAAVAVTALVLFLLTLLIDTDRKRVKRVLFDMMTGIEQRNLDRTFGHITEDCLTQFAQIVFNKQELRDQADRAVRGGGVKRIYIWDFVFETVEQDKIVVFFKAKPFGDWATGWEYCGCQAEFRLEKDGRWRMTRLKLFRPESTEALDWPL